MELKLFETFNTKQEAIWLINLLDENNIPFIQKSEDAGGKFANLGIGSRIKIFISSEDEEKISMLISENTHL